MPKHIDCGEYLSDPDGFKAICVQQYGAEHSHNDLSAREAVARGLAEEAEYLVPCEGIEWCGDLVDPHTAFTFEDRPGYYCEDCYLRADS